MAIKRFKPTSAGRRDMTAAAFDEVTKSTPERSFLRPLTKSGGRNNNGRITMRRRGGGYSAATASLISSVAKSACPRPLQRLSTIQTAVPASRSCTTQTARRHTSFGLQVLR